MTIVEVNNARFAREFIELPGSLYKDDPNWISPLDTDVSAIFDPKRNSFFNHGVCRRWLLMGENKKAIGRIAAFVNYGKLNKNSRPAGGIGFFECINNSSAAFLLFDTAKQWLKEQDSEAMDGPINFGENDKYWGLLIEGFKSPSLGMNYNPSYYKTFFEEYGFEKLYDQYTNFLDATVALPDRFTRISDRVMSNPGYSFRHFSKKSKEQFFKDFQEIYNDAWEDFENFTPIELETIRESFRQMKPIMDEKIIWFAYYEHEPIAFVVCMPDINQVLKHVKGKMNLLGKLKFLWYKNMMKVDRLRIIILGCKKKFQNRGVESALIRCLQEEVLPRNTIKGVELAWVGDFNQKMLALHEATGAVRDKVHRTYRLEFGRTQENSAS